MPHQTYQCSLHESIIKTSGILKSSESAFLKLGVAKFENKKNLADEAANKPNIKMLTWYLYI